MSRAAPLPPSRPGAGDPPASLPRTDKLDWPLVLAVAALLGIGLVMVTSASIAIAAEQTGDSLYFLKRQGSFIGLGLLLAAAVYQLKLTVWYQTRFILLALAYALLILVLLPNVGHTVNGSTRWILLGPIGLQVSEPAKLLVLLYLAGYAACRPDALRDTVSGFLRPIGVLAVVACLLLLEPDFGAAAVLFGTGFALLFLAGARLVQFITLVLAAGASAAVLAISSPERLERLTTFINPWADPYDTGFQLTQALIAIGRGELVGVGLGASVQKLFYLPEAHNDFLFAVLAEELGFIGVLTVIALYGVVLWRGLVIAAAAEYQGQRFGALLAYVLTIWMGLQAFINMGVNLGILPTKGLTLPLLSYGGSSMLICCISIGLLLRVHRETVERGALPRPRGSS